MGLNRFWELAETRIADAGKRDKIITIKVSINTAKMMLEREKTETEELQELKKFKREYDQAVNTALIQDKPTVRIEKWTRLHDRLVGQVYGHPRFLDGTEVTTSSIIGESCDGVSNIVETKNTNYILGQHI